MNEAMNQATILETERLRLRELSLTDAPFIMELVNDPAFIANIGDRGVRNIEDAENYLRKGPLDSYAKNGFGLWLVELKDSQTPIGMCGLLRREALPDVDVGYAFLPQFRGKGYALEAAAAATEYGFAVVGLKRIVAICVPQNVPSIRVLEKIGLRLEGEVVMPGETVPVSLYGLDRAPAASP